MATKCPFLALSSGFSPPNLAVEMLFCAVVPPGLPREEGMILGLVCGEMQLEFGPSLESAAKPREILGTSSKTPCSSGQGRA